MLVQPKTMGSEASHGRKEIPRVVQVECIGSDVIDPENASWTGDRFNVLEDLRDHIGSQVHG